MIQGGGGIEWKGLAVSIFLFFVCFRISKIEILKREEGNGDECGRLLANNPILKCICVCICICICICLMRGRKGWWVRTTPCQLIPAWRALRLSAGHHRLRPPGLEFKYCLSFCLFPSQPLLIVAILTLLQDYLCNIFDTTKQYLAWNLNTFSPFSFSQPLLSYLLLVFCESYILGAHLKDALVVFLLDIFLHCVFPDHK